MGNIHNIYINNIKDLVFIYENKLAKKSDLRYFWCEDASEARAIGGRRAVMGKRDNRRSLRNRLDISLWTPKYAI